jgi:glycogen debranching enzyme
VEGTLKHHTDRQNFLVHGDDETWMYAPTARASRGLERGRTETFGPRGNRAVEVQHLWYYQQLIASFVASFVGDTVSSKQWSRLAGTTESNFNKVFIDTTTNLVFDHLNNDGAGVAEVRPNPLLGLEIIGSELVKQTMIKHIVANLAYPHGVGTLWSGDPRFRPSGRLENGPSIGRAVLNGPVWTALHGQLIYALTRYDRQDLGYLMTRQMVRQILERDMAGSLPEMFETAPRPGETVPRPAGLRASLPALAEFVRSVYQDYLGISVNTPANQIVLQPKLPVEIRSVDFSVSAGVNTIHGRYELETVTSRMILWSHELDRPVRISFLWMLNNGDAWRGVAMLEGGRKLTIVFGADDLLAYQDEKEIEPVSKRKLKGFSQKAEFSGVEFAVPRWGKDPR